MQAADKNHDPSNEMTDVVDLPSISPVASFDSVDPSHTAHSSRSSYCTPIGESLKAWAPLVIKAIIVPGGIVIAVTIVVRRWYRNRAVRAATFA
jgi:hypothetical protein